MAKAQSKKTKRIILELTPKEASFLAYVTTEVVQHSPGVGRIAERISVALENIDVYGDDRDFGHHVTGQMVTVVL